MKSLLTVFAFMAAYLYVISLPSSEWDAMLDRSEIVYDLVRLHAVPNSVPTTYHVNIHGTIYNMPREGHIIHTLMHADDNDTIMFDINSGGGELGTALTIMEYMKWTRAHITGHVGIYGAASAAADIAMSIKAITFYPTGQLLIHTAKTVNRSTGARTEARGVMVEVRNFNSATLAARFFTADEIMDMLLNEKDVHIPGYLAKQREIENKGVTTTLDEVSNIFTLRLYQTYG